MKHSAAKPFLLLVLLLPGFAAGQAVPAVKDITQTLGLLHGHVSARVHASGR